MTMYVALLRGINVGGNSPVSMTALKEVFEGLGAQDVMTYINSGNVMFRSAASVPTLTGRIESAIAAATGLNVPTLIRTAEEMRDLMAAIPAGWTNGQGRRCNVLFLCDALDDPSVLDKLPWNPDADELIYVKGAVVWHVDPALVSKSRMPKLIGTPMYKQMTVRNSNTVRRLATLMEADTPRTGKAR